MTALSADRTVPVHKVGAGILLDYTVEASETIFAGAFVEEGSSGVQAGDVGGGTPEAVILGIAQHGAAAGEIVQCLVGGIVELAISSVAFSDMNASVYASDDQTATLVKTTNPYIGSVIQVQATGTALVKMNWPGQEIAPVLV